MLKRYFWLLTESKYREVMWGHDHDDGYDGNFDDKHDFGDDDDDDSYEDGESMKPGAVTSMCVCVVSIELILK